MLRLFQNISPLSIFLLLIYFAALSLHVILNPLTADFSNSTFSSSLLLNSGAGFAGLLPNVLLGIALVSIFLQGIILCLFMQYFKIISRLSLIPAVIFYLLCFLFEDLITFFPLLLLNFLLILLLFRLFAVYNKPNAVTNIFDLGLLLAIIIVLYFPAFVFIVFALYGIFKLRSSSLRDTAIFFSAIVLIYFLLATAFYWYDSLPLFIQQFPLPEKFTNLQVPVNTLLLVKFLLCACLLIPALLFMNAKSSSVVIQVRKYFACLVVYAIFALAAAIPANPLTVRNIYPALFPAGILISYFLLHLKNKDASEIIHIALLGTVLLFQYINFAG